jgi:toxin-antitoxin system PIN domain toxin
VSIALLDVNVLIALLDPAHLHHGLAHRWLDQNRKHGWATCPMTINGCIRILSSPAYPAVKVTPAEVAGDLRSACSVTDHHFWEDSVSLIDESLFRVSMIGGHQKITDAYLLGLAVRNHGRLATFDRTISLKAVHGASPGNLVLIGSG